MMRAIALSVAALTLCSCAKPSASIPPVETPAPKAVDVRVCAALPARPAFPADAALVQPETIEERLSFEAFMKWAAGIVEHDDLATAQADLARSELCKA
jgi:hypothetical protein